MSILLYPPYLQWEVVSDCNHKCIHCYNYWRADNIEVAKHSDFEAVTEQIIARKPVYAAITGGEPLLVFDQIKPCLSKMVEAGIRLSISSNGTLITEEIAKFYQANNIDTVISLPSIKKCIRAKRELMLDVDFSVCVPDCAFDSQEEYMEIDRGDCYAGNIAYSIGTNGEVKACQCDIKTYVNILNDDFGSIYAKMSEWRSGGMIPEECASCNRVYTCRGGCRVEAFANGGYRKTLPTFADLNNIPEKYNKPVEIMNFADNSLFEVSKDAKFLQDKECFRVSVGIVAVHLTNDFAEWLQENKLFKFSELLNISNLSREELTLIVNMLIKNKIINIADKC